MAQSIRPLASLNAIVSFLRLFAPSLRAAILLNPNQFVVGSYIVQLIDSFEKQNGELHVSHMNTFKIKAAEGIDPFLLFI